MEEFQKQFGKIINEINNEGLKHFEGYSPADMHRIIYDTFGKNSPIQLLKLGDSDYNRIPILNQIRYLLKIIDNHIELKLTKKGYLPTKIVTDIYGQGFIKDEFIESGIYKLYKETDSNTINLTRILIEISGLGKKRNNKLSLTKKGKSLMGNDFALLSLLFITLGNKFNWAYYDGYGQNSIGQLGFGFTLILLSKYGSEKRLDKYYSGKYFKAFPYLIDEITDSQNETNLINAERCYSLRTFDRFLEYFGIIEVETTDRTLDDKYIFKTELFDKLIKCQQHNNSVKIYSN